jgi:hypothetical protein
MINAEIAIISANYLKDYKIALKYNDGKTNVVDFEMFIKSSRTRIFKNTKIFKNLNCLIYPMVILNGMIMN